MKENQHQSNLLIRYSPKFLVLLSILLISSACTPVSNSSSSIFDPLDSPGSNLDPSLQNQIQSEIELPLSIAEPATEVLELVESISTLESSIETENIEETQEFIENNSLLTIPADIYFPPPAIKIYTPGDMSRVVSPFKVVGEIPKESGTHILVELFGEDSRILDRQLIDYFAPTSLKSSSIATEIQFETQAVAEAGKLRFTLIDEFGILQSIISINLILLREGFTENTGYGDLQGNLIIQQPIENSVIHGENVFVSGYVRVGNLEPLSVKIIDEDGQILGTAEAMVLETTNSEYALFLASVPFSIKSPVKVQLTVESLGTKIPGTNFLSSVIINLEP